MSKIAIAVYANVVPQYRTALHVQANAEDKVVTIVVGEGNSCLAPIKTTQMRKTYVLNANNVMTRAFPSSPSLAKTRYKQTVKYDGINKIAPVGPDEKSKQSRKCQAGWKLT